MYGTLDAAQKCTEYLESFGFRLGWQGRCHDRWPRGVSHLDAGQPWAVENTAVVPGSSKCIEISLRILDCVLTDSTEII